MSTKTSSKTTPKTTKTIKPTTKSTTKTSEKPVTKPTIKTPVKPAGRTARPVVIAAASDPIGNYVSSMLDRATNGSTIRVRHEQTVRGLDLGLSYAERAFVDNFREVPFMMRLGESYGNLHFTQGDDMRWGIFYADAPRNEKGELSLYHVSDLDLMLQSVIAQRLQAFWDVGVAEQNKLIGVGHSAMEALRAFSMQNLSPIASRSTSPRGISPRIETPASA